METDQTTAAQTTAVQDYPVRTAADFQHIQMVLTHFVSHPRLGEITEELSNNTETFTDASTFLRDKGFDLPDDAKVSLTRNSPHVWHLCMAADGGAYSCVHITLPSISFG